MNEQTPEATPVESTPLPMPYKDRSTGLTVFGCLTILLGCLAGLLVLIILAGQAISNKSTGTHAPLSTVLPVISIYGVLAVALVWLGIGSIKARRWARALLLIFSWSWLIMGVLAFISMVYFLPKVLANVPPPSGTSDQPAMPAGAMRMVMAVIFVMYGIIFIIIPTVWTFFYNSRHVKATCEARDPVTGWTDACPLPVLGFCLWLAFSVPMMLVMPLAGHVAMPFFGMFLTGLPGSLFCLAIAVIWSYAAWRLYKLDVRGWWLILIAMCVFMVSAVVTFAHHDMIEMYRLMNYPEAQIEQMQKIGLLTGNRMGWLMSLSVLPFLGYLVFIRKFLFHK